LSLAAIKGILEESDFDVLQSLRSHRVALGEQVGRLNRLIHTVDLTILHLEGGLAMSKKSIFEGFHEEKQEAYARQARQLYGRELVDESMKRWDSYSDQQKDQIRAEGEAIYQEIFENMGNGYASPEVQTLIARWHQHIRYFYEPTWDILRGLGQMYKDSPDFRRNFEKLSADFPEFLSEAIQLYCEGK
jgi:hypothetical protein